MDDVLYIITGTTRGIGHELKKILLDNSSNIICLNRKKIDSYDYKVDLSHIEEVSAVSYHLRERIAREYAEHSIIFVNNAFSLGPIGRISDVKSHEIVNSLTTNILSPLILLKLLTELSNKLYIINITSGSAYNTNRHLGLYSSSKLFVENFLKFIEIENNNCLGIYNFNPGITKTGMYEMLSESKKFENENFNKAIPNDPVFVANHLYNISKEITND
mgnify:FL=1|tara:strand:- start:13231 stop:13884 length:654 start_codon:yes stop_codon:yes gene_type:complete